MTDDERRALAERVRAAAKELEQAMNAADSVGLFVEIGFQSTPLLKVLHGRGGTLFTVQATVRQEI